jgi:hypothetical protein
MMSPCGASLPHACSSPSLSAAASTMLLSGSLLGSSRALGSLPDMVGLDAYLQEGGAVRSKCVHEAAS